MARIYGLVSGHPLQADSPVAPSSVPFDSPPRTPLPYIYDDLRTFGGSPAPGPVGPARVPNKISGLYHEALQLDQWFEMAHALPRSIDLGRILATTNVDMTVHNAYRRQTITWNSFVNGAGAGTELTGPTPPQILSPQESTIDLVLVVGTDGVPVVDDILSFGFTSGDSAVVPIALSRLVYFPFFPQHGFTEELSFLTDVLRSKDGTEKRASLRRVPRVRFKLQFREEDDGGDLLTLHHFLLGRPASTFGIPLWHESTVLTTAQSVSDTVINVRQTDYRQFIAGGVGVVFRKGLAPDIFQIDSFTDTTITPVNPMVGDFPVGTLVMPVKLAKATARQRGSRWPVTLGQLAVEFDVLDILEDLADLSAWGTYNSKVLIDDYNAMGRGSVREAIEADVVVLDNGVGPLEKYTFAPNGRFVTQKQWAPQGISKLWDVRALLYSLRGQQASFYMPTDRDDLVAIADLSSGSDALSITYVGLIYVFGNGYRDHIRVTLYDGTVYEREIIDVSQNEAGTEEYLQLASTWPTTHAFADVRRIEFLQNVRLAADTISLKYEPGRPGARVNIPLTAVLGE